MISLRIKDTRKFMSHLLVKDTFDNFLLSEASINTSCILLKGRLTIPSTQMRNGQNLMKMKKNTPPGLYKSHTALVLLRAAKFHHL